MEQKTYNERKDSFNKLIIFLEESAKIDFETEKENVFKTNKNKFEIKNTKHIIEICESIELDSPKYKEDLEEKENLLRKRLEDEDEYTAFSVNRMFLSVCPGTPEFAEPDELYLNLEATVYRNERPYEYKARVLDAVFYNRKRTVVDFLLEKLDLKISERKLSLTYKDKTYNFDIKIQKMDELNKLEDSKEIYRFLKSKSKQIKFKN